MPTSHKRRVQLAQQAHARAMDAIFAAAPNNTTPFADCLLLATEADRRAYNAAWSALYDAEHAAVAAGKAWHGTFGMLHWSR